MGAVLLFVNMDPWNEIGDEGSLQPGTWSALQVPAVVHLAVAAHQGKTLMGAACAKVWWLVLQSTQLLFSAVVGPLNLAVLSSRRKQFRGNFHFVNFICILKVIFNHFSLLLSSCPCGLDVVFIKLMVITKVHRPTSQSWQPPPAFWLQSAISWLCIWTCVLALPDLSSYSTLLLAPNGSAFQLNWWMSTFSSWSFRTGAVLYCKQDVS